MHSCTHTHTHVLVMFSYTYLNIIVPVPDGAWDYPQKVDGNLFGRISVSSSMQSIVIMSCFILPKATYNLL